MPSIPWSSLSYSKCAMGLLANLDALVFIGNSPKSLLESSQAHYASFKVSSSKGSWSFLNHELGSTPLAILAATRNHFPADYSMQICPYFTQTYAPLTGCIQTVLFKSHFEPLHTTTPGGTWYCLESFLVVTIWENGWLLPIISWCIRQPLKHKWSGQNVVVPGWEVLH
jgi:hypothetical protein